MKQSILLLFALLSGVVLMAQTSPATATDDGGSEREDQIIFDINHDRLLNMGDDVEQKIWSRGINIYLMYDIPIANENFSFGIGAGFSSSNYFTNAGVQTSVIDSTTNQTFSSFVPFDDDLDYKRNKLSVNYLDIPVEFRVRTNENAKGNRFKLALGAKLGRTVNVHDKFIADNGDKFKTYIFPNVRDWRYGVTGRIGYGKVTLSGFYSLVSLFDTNAGEDVTPISVGISIIPF